MQPPSHAVLVSSPLQAIVVDALLAAETIPRDDVIVFVEGENLPDTLGDVSCVRIADTRLAGRQYIAANLAMIEARTGPRATLWLSDLLWPMNNALYTKLRSGGRLDRVNFFDEGLVLYWQERFTLLNLVREWVKFRVLGRRLGLAFVRPARAPFYGNRFNGAVYALHPQLLEPDAPVSRIAIDLDRIAATHSPVIAAAAALVAPGERAALVLSQPYYRITEEADFMAVMGAMTRHLRSAGYERLLIKLHPSEGVKQFDRFYRDLGFEMAFPNLKGPIEVALQALPATVSLLSFNSSALLNARIFGFQGEVISYGLDWVATRYPLHRNLFGRTASLFDRVGVAVVKARN